MIYRAHPSIHPFIHRNSTTVVGMYNAHYLGLSQHPPVRGEKIVLDSHNFMSIVNEKM